MSTINMALGKIDPRTLNLTVLLPILKMVLTNRDCLTEPYCLLLISPRLLTYDHGIFALRHSICFTYTKRWTITYLQARY